MSSETNLQTSHAADYGNKLLESLGFADRIAELSDHPAIAWKRSGLLKTTGLILPSSLAAHADGALMALKALTSDQSSLPKNGALLLGERARLRQTIRKGRWSAGGYGRLMDAFDGRIALNLVREDDWDLVPAWLEGYVTDWDGIAAKVSETSSDYLVERAAEIGLAVAKETLPDRPKHWFTAKHFEQSKPNKNPLIVDLSGLWAGPLASSLLMELGAIVVKVEGPDRPDGMREGHAGFYKLVNAGKMCAAFDFKTPEGLRGLRSLLEKADIVIEASRPRAFEQLGIIAGDFVSRKPGKVWARLTAYGRHENRIGFGDDIGIAAGLSAVMDQAHGEPCFVGDAIADPVNALHLALAVWAHYQGGGGAVIDLSMHDVLRYAMWDLRELGSTAREWAEIAKADESALYPLRKTNRRIHGLGEDNECVSGISPPRRCAPLPPQAGGDETSPLPFTGEVAASKFILGGDGGGTTTLLKNVEVYGEIVDVRLKGKMIFEIAPSLEGEADIDGQGGALLPGLHDHHIHLNATAAAMNSVHCGPPDVMTEDELIVALSHPGEGFLRGVGYHHSVAGEINRVWLDANGPGRPVRIQHRSGRLWILNSRAMDALGISTPKDGRLYDSDHIIRRNEFPDLGPLIKRLHSYGITGVTEVTPSNGMTEFENYLENAKGLNLSIMGKAELTGINHARRGHLKLHYHDHDLPPLEQLAREIAVAHDVGRPVAAHCVTRAELMMTLAAIEEAGPLYGDRIEHAAIADEAAIEWMQKLGVIVVTQPNFIKERQAAYIKDVPESDHANLWRLKSFVDAELPLAAGSDAPFGDPNPWAAMAAAVDRPAGFGQDEAVTPEEALAIYTKPAGDAGGKPRKVEVGSPADLILLDRGWGAARKDLAGVKVISLTA